MGVAGSGKSSQGRRLADEHGLPWVSTGEFFRMLVAGQKRKDMLAGKLLDDEEVIKLVSKIFAIVDTDHDFILDGFPRRVAQADWLLNEAKHHNLEVTAVINLQASEAVVSKRLLSRGRPDDTPESIRERFDEYQQETLPIIEHFKQAGVNVIDINADQPVDTVYALVEKALGKVQTDVHQG